jgi:hypothetical protein
MWKEFKENFKKRSREFIVESLPGLIIVGTFMSSSIGLVMVLGRYIKYYLAQ